MTTPVPTPPAEPLPAAPRARTFTAEKVEKFRQDEREKLNALLDKEKSTTREQAKELAELRAKAKADTERELTIDELLAKRQQEWEAAQAEHEAAVTAQIAALEAQREQDHAKMNLERQALQLQNYIATKVSAALAAKEIAPQFVDFLGGYDEAEVDASIEKAKAATAEIVAEVQGQQPPPRPRGVSTATGPSAMGSVSEVEGEPLDYTKMSMRDFIRNRSNLGIGKKDPGIFG